MTSTPEDASSTDLTAEGVEVPAADAAAADAPAVAVAPIDETVARELALAALHEITPAATIGEFVDSSTDAEGVLTVRFGNRMPGYPGWFWTVSLAQVEESAPTVLEAELMPGEGALTAPDWLPWAERLAEYQAAQAALAAEGLATDELEDDEELEDELDDVDDLDAADFDEDASPILHSGDVDGVDIDVLSDDADEDADAEESDTEESDTEESDTDASDTDESDTDR